MRRSIHGRQTSGAALLVALFATACSSPGAEPEPLSPALAFRDPPPTRDFGEIAAGTSSSTMRATVESVGNTAATALEPSIGGPDASEFSVVDENCSGRALDHEETCWIDIVFAPTGAGERNARLDVRASKTDTISMLLIGTSPAADGVKVELVPRFHRFGLGDPGTVSLTHDFTVTNTGAARVGQFTVSIEGADAEMFTVVDNQCSGTALEPDAACTISVMFEAVVSVDEGMVVGEERSATLRVLAGTEFEVAAELIGFGNPVDSP